MLDPVEFVGPELLTGEDPTGRLFAGIILPNATGEMRLVFNSGLGAGIVQVIGSSAR
jgi:hypothetical protein